MTRQHVQTQLFAPVQHARLYQEGGADIAALDVRLMKERNVMEDGKSMGDVLMGFFVRSQARWVEG